MVGKILNRLLERSALAALALITTQAPLPASAADAQAAEGAHIVGYVSDEATLKTERIAYNAAMAAGGVIDLHDALSPVEAADLTAGSDGRVVVGVTENQVGFVTDKLVKIDIPIGEVKYFVYAKAISGIKANGWGGVKALKAAAVVRHGYITAHFDAYINTESNDESFRKVLSGEADIIVLHKH